MRPPQNGTSGADTANLASRPTCCHGATWRI